MKVLLIGYGSIGKRHEAVLREMDASIVIHIVTKQDLPGKQTFKTLQEVKDLQDYDYFVIASTTAQHYDDLKFLEKNVRGKTILCEKPLFNEKKDLDIQHNSVVVGYVLRFHPLLRHLKKSIQNEKVYFANIRCGSYLPTWRKGTDYRTSYSAHKDQGGGVLLDLSHEIDYLQWMFGKLSGIKSDQVKISDLDIDADDLVNVIGRTDNGVVINLSIDYISKISHRSIMVHTETSTYELDFLEGYLLRKDKEGKEEQYRLEEYTRNEIFIKMHEDVLNDQKVVCNFKEGMDVMDSIHCIQEQSR